MKPALDWRTALLDRREIRRSFLLAVIPGVLLSVFGASVSMALTHGGGGPLIVLFLPALAVLLLVPSVLSDAMPEWIFVGLALFAEIVGVFLFLHTVRCALRIREQKRGY